MRGSGVRVQCTFDRRMLNGAGTYLAMRKFLGRGRRQDLCVLQDDTTRTGGFLYPGRKDADLSYRINAIMDRNEELYPTYRQFLVPIAPDYKNRETHLKTFIDVHFPQYLKELE